MRDICLEVLPGTIPMPCFPCLSSSRHHVVCMGYGCLDLIKLCMRLQKESKTWRHYPTGLLHYAGTIPMACYPCLSSRSAIPLACYPCLSSRSTTPLACYPCLPSSKRHAEYIDKVGLDLIMFLHDAVNGTTASS